LSEIRWNPMIREWIIIDPGRAKVLSLKNDEEYCPFCPGSESVPPSFDVHCLKNLYPIFSGAKSVSHFIYGDLGVDQYKRGISNVIIHSPDHFGNFENLSVSHIAKIVKKWKECYASIQKMEGIRFIHLFQNYGELFASQPHPHSQLVGFPFLPKLIERQVQSFVDYFDRKESCFICKASEIEDEFDRRIIYENKHFVSVIPYYARWPYEIHIYPRRHLQNLTQISTEETADFARALKSTFVKIHRLAGTIKPYMMNFHQLLQKQKDSKYFHFHVEIVLPTMVEGHKRVAASSELGIGIFVNFSSPEKIAQALRSIDVL
jgi:UDPglucose--hexose-1-phosphate uridylyltransferase